MDILSPDQLTHIWVTATVLLATKGLDKATSGTIELLSHRISAMKDWAFGRLGYTKIPALLADVEQHPQDTAKQQALQDGLTNDMMPADLAQVRQMMATIQELVTQLQPINSSPTTQNNSGSGNNVSASGAQSVAAGIDAAGRDMDKSTHHHKHYHYSENVTKLNPPTLQGNFWPHPKLAELEQSVLQQFQTDGLTGLTACWADGGLGKTTLAYNLLQQPSIIENYPSRAILQVGPDVKDKVTAQNCLRRLLIEILEVESDEIETHLLQKPLHAWQKFEAPVLLVLDDVWHREALDIIASALPANVHRLITCRDKKLLNGLGYQPILLNFLSDTEGEAVFLSRIPLDIQSRLNSDNIRSLVRMVHGHMGCVVALAGQVSKNEVNPAGTLAGLIINLKERGLSEQPSAHTEVEFSNQVTLTNQVVYRISWDSLSEDEQQTLLKLSDLPVGLPLTRDWLLQLLNLSEQLLDNHLNRLLQLNLLTIRRAENGTKDIYQITDWTRSLAPTMGVSIWDEINWNERLDNFSQMLYENANYLCAEPFLKRALAVREKLFGPNHPITASMLNKLGILYYTTGRYAEAETIYKHTLAITEEQFGPSDPFTAISAGNLGILYKSTGQYDLAEPLLKQALDICERHLEPHHPDTFTSINNLGHFYNDTHRYNEAEPLLLRAYDIFKHQIQLNNTYNPTILNNLAVLYTNTNRYAVAEDLLLNAITLFEQQFRPDHPSISHPISNLAGLYYNAGFYKKAEPHYQRALTILECSLGPEHPDTKIIRKNLSNCHQAMGR